MSVELALTCDRRWQVDLATMVEAASEAGFASIGIGAELVDERSRTELSSRGQRCHELMALVVSNNAQATIASAEQLADKAASIGAPWVVTVFAAVLNNDTMTTIKRCAEMFAEVGARIAVEFSPLGSVTSIRDGLEVATALGTHRAGLLIDTWHFFSGNSTWEDLAHVPLDLLAYVQFADALPAISDDGMDETMNRRTMPGDGIFDLERFASTLLDRGWAGTVSVEVLSRDLAVLPVTDFARIAYESTSPYWV